MAPPLLFDIGRIDLDHVEDDIAGIEKINLQRGHMRMLDGVIYFDRQVGHAIAYKDVRDDEFWVAGHIPGRPLLPGVLMIEAGAQLASYMLISHDPSIEFLGFVGCEEVKFRGAVGPGDRLMILGEALEMKPRRCICKVQALVDGSLVFEAKIKGMQM